MKLNCSFPPKSMERTVGNAGGSVVSGGGGGGSLVGGGVGVGGLGNSGGGGGIGGSGGGQYYMSVLPGSHATNSDGESYVYLQQHCVPPPPAISALTGTASVNNYDDIKGQSSDVPYNISVHTLTDHPSTTMVQHHHHHPEQVSTSSGSYSTGITKHHFPKDIQRCIFAKNF